jgi:E3 ubiquitin-protein ligase SHPRH
MTNGTAEAQPEDNRPKNDEPVPLSKRVITYNHIDKTNLDNIQNMDSFGDYGSKIQTIVRHLLHLKFSDPGSKSIVFSAWADSLFSTCEHNGPRQYH